MRQTILAGTTHRSPHAGLPPPLNVELTDAGRAVGWIADARIGFRGFASDVEASHAAWVAWRALQRRAARRLGVRPVPIDTEPLTVRRSDDQETILAGTRPIGILLRPGTDPQADRDSFAFELQLPASTGEVGLRAKAYVVYRALRKSGVRWALWRPDVTPASETIAESSTVRAASERLPTDRTEAATATTDPSASTPRGRDDETLTTTQILPEVITLRARVTFTAVAVVAGLALLAMVPPALFAPLALFLLAPFLAVRLLVRIDKRNAHGHALRSAGSGERDLAATLLDQGTTVASRRDVSGQEPARLLAWTRRIASRWNRRVASQRVLRERRAWRRGNSVLWTSVAMLGASMAALAFVGLNPREVALALASVGAVAFIGVTALRLSARRERWARLPSRIGFNSAAHATRTSRSDGPGYRAELHTQRRPAHEAF